MKEKVHSRMYHKVWLWKPIGYTPLQCVDYVKQLLEEKKLNSRVLPGEDVRVAFAGRLDPMACGILPVVIAPKAIISKVCDSINGGMKTYRFSMYKGMKTDTYDILGRIILSNEDILTLNQVRQLKTQKYPIYSTKTIKDSRTGKMKSLFEFAREGRSQELIDQDLIPQHPITIDYINEIEKETKYGKEMLVDIYKSLDCLQVNGFGVEEVREGWKNTINPLGEYQMFTYEARVSSGTYIRGLVNSMGGTAFHIHRTSIGDYIGQESVANGEDLYSIITPKIMKITS